MNDHLKPLAFFVALSALWACPANRATTNAPVPTFNSGSARRPPTPKPPVPTSPAATSTPETQGPSPSPRPTPVPSAQSNPGFRQLTGTRNPDGKTTLRGAVWSLDGTPFDQDVRITVSKEIDGQEKTQESNLVSGGYQFDALGEVVGIVDVTAYRYNQGPRRQKVGLLPGFDYVLNFGAPDDETQMYGLSSFPEITEVTPDFGASGIPGVGINVSLELSEPMPAQSLQNLAAALRLLPGNEVSSGDGTRPPDLAPDLPGAALQPASATLSDFPYSVKFFEWLSTDEGKKLLPQSQYEAIAAYTPDESQRKITVTFPAPLLNGTPVARYQLALASDPEHPIKDADDNLLGTDATGKLGTMAPAGQFIQNAFLPPRGLVEYFKKEDTNTRWSSTHVSASAFTLAEDKDSPVLRSVGVTVRDVDNPAVASQKAGTTFELRFSKPLIPALGDRTPSQIKAIKELKNYSFAVGSSLDYLGTTTLLKGTVASGTQPLEVGVNTTNFGSAGESQLGKEFRLVDPENTVKIEFAALSAIRIFVPNKDLFDREKATAIAIRVSGITDASGNSIPAEAADSRENQPRIAITYPVP